MPACDEAGPSSQGSVAGRPPSQTGESLSIDEQVLQPVVSRSPACHTGSKRRPAMPPIALPGQACWRVCGCRGRAHMPGQCHAQCASSAAPGTTHPARLRWAPVSKSSRVQSAWLRRQPSRRRRPPSRTRRERHGCAAGLASPPSPSLPRPHCPAHAHPSVRRTLRVAFRSPGAATMAKRSLEVDEELRPEAVDCSLSVDGSDLVL